MSCRFAALGIVEGMFDDWESIDIRAFEAGSSFGSSSLHVWPCLAPERLSRIVKMRSLSHQTAAADLSTDATISVWSWRREVDGGDEVTYMSHETMSQHVILLLIASFPEHVSVSEAKEMLPDSGASAENKRQIT